MASYNTPWTQESLAEWRLKMDPFADEVITTIAETDSVMKVNELFYKLIRSNEDDFSDMPPIVEEYFKESAVLPSWADHGRILKAQRFFGVYGPQISTVLLCKCLPASYSAWRGSEVLFRTGRLTMRPGGDILPLTRRIMETSQFIVNVLSPEGFNPGGLAIRSAQKVRLVHALIRHYLRIKQWDVETYGEPINQEDMAGTLMAFSLFTLEGLKQLGVELTMEEEYNYMHTWNVVGHIMGIDFDLMPKTVEEGYGLGHLILDINKGPSLAGKELTRALVAFLEHVIPGTAFDRVPIILMRHMLGDEISEMLEVPFYNSPVDEILPKVTQMFLGISDNMFDNSSLLRKVSDQFNRVLLQGLINYFNEDKGTRFYIPPGLKQSWGIDFYWEDRVSTKTVFGYRAVIQKKVVAKEEEQ